MNGHFTSEASPPSFDAFEDDPAVIYTLNRDLRITYCNKAWDRFALENGGSGLGRHKQIGRQWMECIPAALTGFFHTALLFALHTKHRWDHTYECSSPDQFRRFQMQVLPFEPVGLLVINSKAEDRPHSGERVGESPLDGTYTAADGVIRMCCHCRRTFRVGQKAWDWVPQFLTKRPGRVNDTLCDVCLTYYCNLPPAPTPA